MVIKARFIKNAMLFENNNGVTVGVADLTHTIENVTSFLSIAFNLLDLEKKLFISGTKRQLNKYNAIISEIEGYCKTNDIDFLVKVKKFIF